MSDPHGTHRTVPGARVMAAPCEQSMRRRPRSGCTAGVAGVVAHRADVLVPPVPGTSCGPRSSPSSKHQAQKDKAPFSRGHDRARVLASASEAPKPGNRRASGRLGLPEYFAMEPYRIADRNVYRGFETPTARAASRRPCSRPARRELSASCSDMHDGPWQDFSTAFVPAAGARACRSRGPDRRAACPSGGTGCSSARSARSATSSAPSAPGFERRELGQNHGGPRRPGTRR